MEVKCNGEIGVQSVDLLITQRGSDGGGDPQVDS